MAESSQVLEAIERIPQITTPAEKVHAEELGGLTNQVYRIVHNDGEHLLRIPGAGTEEYIDRTVEAHNTRQAAAAGVGAEVIYFDETDGLMLCEYLADHRTMSPQAFRADNAAVARAGEALQRMHGSGTQFKFRFELFSMIDQYLEVLRRKGCPIPDGYHEVVAEAEAVRRALEQNPQELAPCHNDPLCENFLDSGSRIRVVDWEYSGMNEPLWDVGDLSVEAGLSDEQDLELLSAWAGGSYRDSDLGRMKIYKAMCDLLWTLWGLVQYINDNPAEDFWAYASERFERCKALMSTPEFSVYVKAVAAGV